MRLLRDMAGEAAGGERIETIGGHSAVNGRDGAEGCAGGEMADTANVQPWSVRVVRLAMRTIVGGERVIAAGGAVLVSGRGRSA